MLEVYLIFVYRMSNILDGAIIFYNAMQQDGIIMGTDVHHE